MTDEAFEKYQSVWTAVHNLVDKMLSGEAGAEDIRDKLTDEFRFWKRSGHDISATTPQPEQESFSPEAIRATQAAWKMGYDAAKAEQPEQEPAAWLWRCKPHCGWPEWSVSLKRPADAGCDGDKRTEGYEDIPLYTTPPQREWQRLTDKEREEATGWSVEHIEAKLKEKNT